MSTSVEIFGVNNKKLIEDYPGRFKNSQEVSVEELSHLYSESLFEKVYKNIDCGLELFYENTNKKFCFHIYEMKYYRFISFNWHNDEMEVENYESDYKLTKDQLIDLIDWYIALSYVFSDYDNIKLPFTTKEPKYLEEAKRMIDYYSDMPDDENYFKTSGFDFVAFKQEILNSHYDWYYYTYSY